MRRLPYTPRLPNVIPVDAAPLSPSCSFWLYCRNSGVEVTHSLVSNESTRKDSLLPSFCYFLSVFFFFGSFLVPLSSLMFSIFIPTFPLPPQSSGILALIRHAVLADAVEYKNTQTRESRTHTHPWDVKIVTLCQQKKPTLSWVEEKG